MQATLLYKSGCTLGEGSCWHAARDCFYWVDIEERILWEYHLSSGRARHWQYEQRISTIVLDRQGRLVLGAQGGLARFDPATEQFEWLADIPPKDEHHRCNDGKCDPAGRLWIGVMRLDIAPDSGLLYCIDEDLLPELKISRITLPNGIAWTADAQWMYHTDTPARTISAYRYDRQTGHISFDRKAIVIPEHLGFPDGMAIDEEGMLWVCHYGGAGVYRWDPRSGQLLHKVELPAPNVTSCAFGGPDHRTLLVTTARENMPAAQLQDYPLSGHVFTIATPVRGAVLPPTVI